MVNEREYLPEPVLYRAMTRSTVIGHCRVEQLAPSNISKHCWCLERFSRLSVRESGAGATNRKWIVFAGFQGV